MANGEESPLRSWKEIAGHLGVSVRTAQNWEGERGLPVRRGLGSGGRVMAYPAELDDWVRTTSSPGALDRGRPPRYWTVGAALVGIGLLGAGAIYWARAVTQGKPDSARVVHNSLIVSDDHGRELWRRKFDYQLNDYDPNERRPAYLWIGDLDGDGYPEVLFGANPAIGAGDRSGVVICYAHDGRERWRHEVAQSAAAFPAEYQAPYHVAHVSAARVGSSAVPRVIVSSLHHKWFPCQIELLSASGKLEREYWHSGHIQQVVTADLDGSGRSKILAGGVANGYDSAVLVELDADRFGGVSHEDERKYQLPGPAPVEEARVLFPRSCVTRRQYRYNSVKVVQAIGDAVNVWVLEEPPRNGAELAYTFRGGLDRPAVGTSDGFVTRHLQLRSEGKLDHDWSDSELEPLGRIRYLTRPAGVASAR